MELGGIIKKMSEKNAKLIKLYCRLTKKDYNFYKNWFKHLNTPDRIRAISEMKIVTNAYWAAKA